MELVKDVKIAQDTPIMIKNLQIHANLVHLLLLGLHQVKEQLNVSFVWTSYNLIIFVWQPFSLHPLKVNSWKCDWIQM